MTLTIEKVPPKTAVTQTAANDDKDNGAFVKGDAVILNGAVYVDSYGSGKGRTFADYHSTITHTAPIGRPCPYCVGMVGWVYPNEITKG